MFAALSRKSVESATNIDSVLGVEALEHGRILEHVGQHDEANLRAAQVAVFDFALSAVARRQSDSRQLTVHVVLGVLHRASGHLKKKGSNSEAR